MADYGIQVNGAPPTDGLAMLVDVVQTPVNVGAPEGRYLFPTLTDEQKKRFYHYFSAVDSTVMYWKTALQTGGAGKVQIVQVFPILENDASIDGLDMNDVFRSNKVVSFRWKTVEIDYYHAYGSCQAVMVWRGVK